MRNQRSTCLLYTNIFAFSSQWFEMLGEIRIPSSVIDTDSSYTFMYIHAFVNLLKAYCIMYLLDQQKYVVSNVSIFEQVPLNKKKLPLSIYRRDIASLDKRVWRICPSS